MERLEMYLTALETGEKDNLPLAISKFDKRMESIVNGGSGGSSEGVGGIVYNELEYSEDDAGWYVKSAKVYGISVPRYAFQSQYSLTSIELTEGVTNIGYSAFYECESLKSLELPEGLTSIDDSAFSACTSLESLELPKELKSIGSEAFYGCTDLTQITFNGTPTSIGDYAFEYCPNLTTINVPWAEGAVEGAPWGATDATINYNHIRK